MNNGIDAIRYLMAGKTVNFHYSFIYGTSKSLSNSKIMKSNNTLNKITILILLEPCLAEIK